MNILMIDVFFCLLQFLWRWERYIYYWVLFFYWSLFVKVIVFIQNKIKFWEVVVSGKV